MEHENLNSKCYTHLLLLLVYFSTARGEMYTKIR